jgi:ABC-2 type transport system permease protein
MNKTLLIGRHEFLKTIRRVGFIVLTLALPVLSLLGLGVYQIATKVVRPPAELTRIGYVDQTGIFSQYTDQGQISLVPFPTTNEAQRALLNQDISSYFIIPVDFLATGVINLFTTEQALAPPPATLAAIEDFTISNLLAGKVPTEVINRVENPLNMTLTTLTATGEVAPRQGSYLNMIVPGVFSLLLALSLVFTSTYVVQSLSEEKENRLMEILISSVSTGELLTGKVLGLGAAGLAQVLVWVLTIPLMLKLATASIGGFLSLIQVPGYFWVLGVAYFILGYLLFAVLSAAIAAVTSTVQEAQGMAALYTLFNFIPFWFLSLMMIFPGNPVWVVLSFFPFSAPVMVLMRLGITGMPAWQLAASIIILVIGIAGGLWLAGRLLRTYMLMYGKRPNFSEIVRNLRRG